MTCADSSAINPCAPNESYAYDAIGNLTSGGGRTLTWNAENQPASVTQSGVSESYTYNTDNERVRRTTNSVHTFYFGGLAEESGATKHHAYTFNGQTIAERDVPSSGASTFRYLHGDHLGSVAATSTSNTSPTVAKQYFTPWGEARFGSITSTDRNYTGQRKDDTGLLFYNARYYDPKLSRFISPDSIVPGMASGKGGTGSIGVDGDTKSMLTVDFHEPQFALAAGAENAFTRENGFNFESSEEGKYQWGPPNPQALNRYSYVLNNPLRYTDPTGHEVRCFKPGCANTVTNETDGPVEIIGDVRKPGCNQDSPECFETVSATLQPGESSVDYSFADVDFIRPFDENRLNPGWFFDGYGREAAYKVIDGADIVIRKDRKIRHRCRTWECEGARQIANGAVDPWMTMVTTARQQGWNALALVADAVRASSQGRAAPRLMPTP